MVYEEEDFQPMQYGYHLNPDISDQRILGMLREVEDELYKKTRIKPEISSFPVNVVYYPLINICRLEKISGC